jgi:hypothetical protein
MVVKISACCQRHGYNNKAHWSFHYIYPLSDIFFLKMFSMCHKPHIILHLFISLLLTMKSSLNFTLIFSY